jgi:hypothetical protein
MDPLVLKDDFSGNLSSMAQIGWEHINLTGD